MADGEPEEASECERTSTAKALFDAPEASIAVDPIQELNPEKTMQALQDTIEALQSHASKTIRNEKQAKIRDRDTVLQPVGDAGGRQCLRPLILDVQSTARGFTDSEHVIVKPAVAETNGRLNVCPTALAISTQGPLDSFNARTYPACYVEWWFLERARLDRE